MNDFAPPQRPSRKVLVLSLLGLAAFLAVEALLLRHFIRSDARPPSSEQSVNLEIAQDYHDAPSANPFQLAPRPGLPPYPPLYHWLIRGAFDSKDPAHAALWINWFAMALLAVSLFGICWRFLPDGRALAGTLAFCAAPGLQDLLTTQLPDLSVVAFVAAGYWALLECDGFTFLPSALAFGAVFGVGMLVKLSYAAYLIPAFLIGARSLGDRRARFKALAAFALGLAIFLPWYWSHLNLLPAWIVSSLATGGKPFWADGAWLSYLVGTSGELGPLLWGLGLISMLAPQYARRRENAWILAQWVVLSYVVTLLVPDRQWRYLIPGLIPLGLALAATWPPAMSWGVALIQLVGAANFFVGAAGPLPVMTPVGPLVFLRNRPPVSADWKIQEILSTVQATRDPSRPAATLALLADAEFFNRDTIAWLRRYQKLPDVLLRRADERGTELSEFVLLRDAKLEARDAWMAPAIKAIKDPEGWFSTGYEAVQRWTLPDNSVATLYHQKRGRTKPPGGKRLAYLFFEAGPTQVKNLNLELGTWNPASSSFPMVMLSADRVQNGGVAVRGVSADLEQFSYMPMYEGGMGDYAWEDVRLMRLDRMILRSAQLDADEVKPLLERRFPGLKVTRLTLEGSVRVSGMWHDRPVEADAAVEVDRPGRRVVLRVTSASYMGVAIPPAFFQPVQELSYSLAPTAERPFAVDIPGLTIRGGRLTIP